MDVSHFSYCEVTNQIEIEARPFYVDEKSDPAKNFFFYAYFIRITNKGKEPCQLLRRHWIIRDGAGRQEHVEGEGVVGETPALSPGESFEYTSFCPLQTPTGNMRGRYQMTSKTGHSFWVNIPLFFLRRPETFH